MNDVDVVIIGAGGGGPVAAKELGERGIKVALLEAGPWYGNKKWPSPNFEHGSISSSSFEDLSPEILHKCFTSCEGDMNGSVSGKFRWGPADKMKNTWGRSITYGGFAWQNSGVGGTTLQYFANSPRAFPMSIDGVWPISYNEIVPYYEQVEATLPVLPAPMTTKEEFFFYGAKKAGWSLLNTLNVTSPGYRPQPNAILQPPADINDPNFDFHSENGCTLRGHCINGCDAGGTVDMVAKRSTLVSYIPLALKTGNVDIYPNAFATKIITEKNANDGVRAVGVEYIDTWTGKKNEIRAGVVVAAAGCIETPRLWLNSRLPDNPWVGKGMTNHWFDCVAGVFEDKVLQNILGTPNVEPYVGQNSAARFDYPGLGAIFAFGISPGLHATIVYSLSGDGYNFLKKPDEKGIWDVKGRAVGQELKELMTEYPRTLSMLIIIDDEVNQSNGIAVHPFLKDKHGSIPVVKYKPGTKEKEKRDKLASIAADILRKAGAKKVIRPDLPPGIFIHIQSTMRMGYVTDLNCEALQVKRLFIADNSVLYNSLGGCNPTLTTQALAVRTSEKIASKYFS